jgi:RNA polymerase sigma factor (sigma-70 family)
VRHARQGNAVGHIQTLFSVGCARNLTDGELLERFASRDEEGAADAFALLVERHGPMVLRVCQSILRKRDDAEDALQATFLILARKASSIRRRDSVVSWLHGVALRVAACQKGATARRRRHEMKATERSVADADGEDRVEVAAVLHEELDRLPEKYRAPIVLCYFENLSHEQAANQLHWPVGTVRSRLARGREKLRIRLSHRGLVPSIILVERVLCAETARAAISIALTGATARAALNYASGRTMGACVVSTSVNLLVEGAMSAMFTVKMKLALLACGLIATGTFVVAQQVGRDVPKARAQDAMAQASANPLAASNEPDDDAIVARELGQLDTDLLAEEVHQLREQVEVTLRAKLRAERKHPADVNDARRDFEAARASYLAKMLELRAAQRRLNNAAARGEPSSGPTKGLSPQINDSVVHATFANNLGAHPSPAAIGSIDIDAVFKRYEKVKVSSQKYNAALLARKKELTTIQSEAQAEAEMVPKFQPGSEDRRRHESRVTELKARHEAGREQAEREFTRRQAETTATLYREVQETVAALAKARGLTYVVKVSPGPRPDSEPNDVDTALKNSVVYADPRNDLTEAVIAELNRRYSASEINRE